MGLYQKYVLPKIIDFACTRRPNLRQRKKVVPLARGRVLEIGFGSGINLPYYDSDRVEHVWALEPSKEMWSLAGERLEAAHLAAEFVEASAQDIPLEDACADTVLITYTLCTIPETLPALGEMRRVLKPGGELIFCEHGAAPDPGVRKWQDRLNPLWKVLGGGCNMNRDIPALLEEGGFEVRSLATMYLPGWKPASFNYWGSAVPAAGR